jgi:hypothetical protein
MKYLKFFENFLKENLLKEDGADKIEKLSEVELDFWRIYLNLHFLCTYFNTLKSSDNIDKSPLSETARIFMENKKSPMDKEIGITEDSLIFNGFPIPYAKTNDEIMSVYLSVWNTIKNDDKYDSRKILGGVNEGQYHSKFNLIYEKVEDIDLSVKNTLNKIWESFYKEKINLKNDFILKETYKNSIIYFRTVYNSIREGATIDEANDIFNIWMTDVKSDRPEFIKKLGEINSSDWKS